MPAIDMELLKPFVTKFLGDANLTPAERAEVLSIAQGFCGKDSAAIEDISPETIRARRKRIYRKLGVAGASELMASMLSLALTMRVERRPTEPQAAAVSAQQPSLHAQPLPLVG